MLYIAGNLYFCFRWLLIWFKREFAFNDVMRIWEVIWSGLPCPNFHLVICLALMDLEIDLGRIKMFTKVSALADIHAPFFGPVFS